MPLNNPTSSAQANKTKTFLQEEFYKLPEHIHHFK